MTRRTQRGALVALALLAILGLVVWLLLRDRDEPGTAPLPTGAAHSATTGELPSYAAPASPGGDAAVPLAVLDGAAGAASVASPTGSFLVRVIWATDRTPAAGVGIRAYFWDSPDPLFSVRNGRTDASGLWEVPDAPVGMAGIFLDRAEGGRVEVRAGAAAELTLEIPAGVFVRGLVLDADEHPVAGSDIWLQYGPEDGAVVAQSGADGRFTVRDIGEQRSLGALAEGHVPSPMCVIADDDTHACDVTLRLGSAGAHLAGRVVDTTGAPVAAVLVRVGPGFGWPPPADTSGLLVRGQPPRRVVTDIQGAFSARDLPPGETPVAMRVHGHSPWSGTVTLHVGENDPLEVVLQDSAVVHGVVSDESGKPIAGVRVSTGDYGDMDWVATKSGSDGSYELADLPLLDRELTALLKGWGQVTTRLDASPGARLEWNPRLVSGLQIFGRVVDVQGAPVTGLYVEGRAYGPGEPTEVKADTDQQGRFTLRNCADYPHVLEVRTPDGSTVVASKRDVRPGPDEIVLQVGDTRRSAFLIGRVVDAQGRVSRLAAVEAIDPRNNQGEPSAVQADTGNFRIGPLLPGEWDLSVVVSHSPAQKCGRFQLAADETRDVGTITLADSGRVVVHVTLPEGVVPGDVSCQLVSADRRPTEFLTLQDKSQPVWFADVEAGNYEVILGSTSGGPERIAILRSRAPVHVEAGKDAEVDIVAQRGVAQTILLSTVRPNPPGPWVSVTDAAGVTVCDEPVQWDQAAPGTLQRAAHTRFIAVPGDYTLVIRSDGREVVSQALTLPGAVNIAPDVSVVVP